MKDFTQKTLPKVYLERHSSLGFEALAHNSNDGLLYAFIQTPMDLNGERKGSPVRRIIAMDPITGEAKHECIYRQSGPINQDKNGDAVYDAERDVIYVIDRDNVDTAPANKSTCREALLGDGVYAPNCWTARQRLPRPLLKATSSRWIRRNCSTGPVSPVWPPASTSPKDSPSSPTALWSSVSTTTSSGRTADPTTC